MKEIFTLRRISKRNRSTRRKREKERAGRGKIDEKFALFQHF